MVEPTLSWFDQQALRSTADATASIARTLEAQGANLSISLGWVGREIAGAVGSLEAELGLRLKQQTVVLGRQLEALERIEAALRQPAKVHAAERLVDAGKLLAQGRYERALPLAQEAMAGDPLNPAGFGAAGWALLGLGRLGEARDHFAEAAVAAVGDERGAYTRRRARLDFGLGNREAAADSLRTILAEALASESERSAIQYDLAAYVADAGDPQGAVTFLKHAVGQDSRYALAALVDPLIRDHPPLLAVATQRLTVLDDEQARATAELRELISATASFLASVPDIESVSDSEPLTDNMVPVQRERIVNERVVTSLRSALAAAEAVVATESEHSAEEHLKHLNAAAGELDRQLQRLRQVAEATPQILEVRGSIAHIDRAIAERKVEVQRLSAQYHREYEQAADQTRALTNELAKYRGRKYNKKLEERKKASDAHMNAMKRWEAMRKIEVGTDPDPEVDRLFEARYAALLELRKLTHPD
jgi:tetratricopeptide (TPR) repeat protein